MLPDYEGRNARPAGETSAGRNGEAYVVMATYVLVHGAWHGAWCWRKVTPLLEAAGHAVVAPTLSGVGELAHLATPDLGTEDHVDDVVNALEAGDLRNAVLVGHSYGGIVIGAAAHRVPERVGHLVYLDALVPKDNASAADVAVPAWIQLAQVQANEDGNGWLVPPPDVEDPFGITDPADAEWVRANLTPQPLKTWADRVRLTDPRAEAIPKTYIRCPLRKHPGPDTLSRHAETARRSPAWRYRELASDHDSLITHPRELADLLLEAARETRD